MTDILLAQGKVTAGWGKGGGGKNEESRPEESKQTYRRTLLANLQNCPTW